MVMAHISRLPNLTSLVFAILPHSWVNPVDDSEQAFASLGKLELVYIAVPQSIKFMQWLRQVPLHKFVITFSTAADTSEARAFFAALFTAISHPSHSELYIMQDALDTQRDYCLKPCSLRLLSCFTNLTEVLIYLPGSSEIDDVTMSDLSRAWSLLETFELGEIRPPPHETQNIV
jgi:hypothetical protein